MSARVVLLAAALAVCLMACGPTPGQVNNSGHDPYLNGDYASALELYRDAEGRAPVSAEPYYNSANSLYRTEEYEEALQSYDESLNTPKRTCGRAGSSTGATRLISSRTIPGRWRHTRKCCA